MKKTIAILTVLVMISLFSTACAQATPKPAADKLEEILARGTLVISTDPAYPPQSELVENAARASDTKCASDQHTPSELSGFDIDVGIAIAEKLGVEACFVTPEWTMITGGSWANRWDISVGSMTITPERMEKLYFTQPYYTTPAAFFVSADNTTFTQPGDLAGKKIGACTGCTYDAYLAGTLSIPGEKIVQVVDNPQFMGYETDINAIQDLALGDGLRLDAVMTALPTGQGAIDDGLPLKQLGEAIYFEYLAVAIDKTHTPDPVPLVKKVTEVLKELHAEGVLLELSQKYYGLDLTTAAGAYDIDSLDQYP
ncbi:MAG: transporter substrate-binding domain-containing protein [Anaerolineales bacterium]|nr:transporter substrate-binding domain-containing protein [Anaerolineales bacterium]